MPQHKRRQAPFRNYVGLFLGENVNELWKGRVWFQSAVSIIRGEENQGGEREGFQEPNFHICQEQSPISFETLGMSRHTVSVAQTECPELKEPMRLNVHTIPNRDTLPYISFCHNNLADVWEIWGVVPVRWSEDWWRLMFAWFYF